MQPSEKPRIASQSSEPENMSTWPRAILFYDGDCPMCSQSVRLLAKLDSRHHLTFSPLSGLHAETLWHSGILPAGATREESIVFLLRSDDHANQFQACQFSDAVLQALRQLPFPLSLAGFLGALAPRKVRDFIYRHIAKRRKTILKNRPLLSCNVPIWLRPHLLP